jgi:hypothetical protein
LAPLILLFLSIAACGGFQVRVTPTAAPPTTDTPAPPPTAEASPTTTPTLAPPTVTPTAAPIAAAAVPAQPGGLAVGGAAKVTATGGLNVRDQAARKGKQIGKLNPGATVTLIGGPTQADNFTWWQIEGANGLKGWVAAGSGSESWLQPTAAAPAPTAGAGATGGRLVNRPVKLGDRVRVTTGANQVLTLRDSAGLQGVPVARVRGNTEFVVRGGPVREDELLWWQLEGEKVNGWAAEGKGEDRWLTPIEP